MDGKVFVGQTKLTITLDTGSKLTDVSVALIKYKKPNGVNDNFIATVLNNTIFYDIASATDLDSDGVWELYAHITYTDTSVIIGEKALLRVYKPGE